MSESEKPHRFIVIGKGGGFSQEIIRQIKLDKSNNPVLNLSTRDIKTQEFQKHVDDILATQTEFKDTVIWSTGSSSNRSNSDDCKKDESVLQEFIQCLLASPAYSPNFCYFSSGGTIYGNSPGIVSETSHLNPQTAYAEMKVRSEEFLLRLAEIGRIGVYLFRIANVYGPNPGIRKNFIHAALLNPEIYLTVNEMSRKQYGTYQDYSKYILRYMDEFPLAAGSKIVQNVYSSYSYSISEILEITEPYSAFKDRRVIRESGSLSRNEDVLLTSVNSEPDIGFKWQSLEDYLGALDLRSEQADHPE
jgi:nucleoside-diphosphate-sugar epimerase